MKTTISLLALALIATPATAGSTKPRDMRLVLPPEYDHQYDGELVIVDANQQLVRDKCPNAKYTLGVALGCAHRGATYCWIYLAPKVDMKAAGFPRDLILRHEIAHCNGWPGDHRGARPFEDWAQDPVPVKYAKDQSRFLFGQ
jgi:hypothetical protein